MYRCMLVIATVATECGRYGAQATVTIAVTGPGVVRTSNLEGDCHATCWFSVEREVRSDPPGIDCPRICAADFPEGTPVSLLASAAAGWGFNGFDGACASSGCTVALGADAATVATFVRDPVQLEVQVDGGGRVFSTPGAIDCPGVCSAIFAPGTALRLTASAAAGSTFAGFSGACSGTACSLRSPRPQPCTRRSPRSRCSSSRPGGRRGRPRHLESAGHRFAPAAARRGFPRARR